MTQNELTDLTVPCGLMSLSPPGIAEVAATLFVCSLREMVSIESFYRIPSRWTAATLFAIEVSYQGPGQVCSELLH